MIKHCELCFDGCWYCVHNTHPGFEKAGCKKDKYTVSFLGLGYPRPSSTVAIDSLSVKHITCDEFESYISKEERQKRIEDSKNDWKFPVAGICIVIVFLGLMIYFK